MDRETYRKLVDLVNAKNEVERQLKELKKEIGKIGVTIKPEAIEDYTYDEIKAVWDSVKYSIDLLPSFDEIIERKKLEQYPELRKAVYYPEINDLPISDAEKMRLDRATKRNYRSHITKYNIGKFRDPLSIEDLEMLKSIGIVEKKYAFMCPECGCSAASLSEDDLKKFLRVWELQQRKRSKEESDELENLYQRGYFEINLGCYECDDCEQTISSREELEEYGKNSHRYTTLRRHQT